MSNPPLRTCTFGTPESGLSGTPAFGSSAGNIPALSKRAGGVDYVGEMTYRLERTTPTA